MSSAQKSTLGVPAGGAAALNDTSDAKNLIATSEDGEWTVRIPRSDLLAPRVTSTFAAGPSGITYRFAIANGGEAATGIQFVVVGSFDAQWMAPASRIDGWMRAANGWNHDGAGIAPGRAQAFSFETGALPGVIPIYLFAGQGDINIPDDAPDDFRSFVMRNAMPDRNSIQALAIGPKLQRPLTFDALKADIEATANLPGFGVLNSLSRAQTASDLADRLKAVHLQGLASQYLDARLQPFAASVTDILRDRAAPRLR